MISSTNGPIAGLAGGPRVMTMQKLQAAARDVGAQLGGVVVGALRLRRLKGRQANRRRYSFGLRRKGLISFVPVHRPGIAEVGVSMSPTLTSILQSQRLSLAAPR